MKVTIRFKGGPGSGHHGHSGRPGKRGGSSPAGGYLSDRKTRRIRGGLYIDEAVASFVETLNKNNVVTSHSCSGHVCDKPLESQISYRAVLREPKLDGSVADMKSYIQYETHQTIKSLVDGDSLELEWTLETRPGSTAEWGRFELYPSGGFYGSSSLHSTDANVRAAVADFHKMEEALESIEYPVEVYS